MNRTEHEIIRPNENLDIMIALINKEIVSGMPDIDISAGISSHWHRSIEFSWLRKGEMTLWTGNTCRHLKAGDFIFVNSSEIHRLTSDNPLECEVVLTIIPYSLLKKFIPDIDHIRFDIYSKPYDPAFTEIFSFYYRCCVEPKENDRLMMNSALFDLLYILMEQYRTEEEADYSQHEIRHALLDYIEEHYRQNLSLKELSSVFHVHPDYLSRQFRQLFGMNFMQYLRQYRLDACMNDVLVSDKSMETIAWEYGFPSVKSFINAFREVYGSTPYQYRIAHRKNGNRENQNGKENRT